MLAYEYGGVLGQPWGAAGFAWPPQLFWNNVPKMNSHSLNEMRAVAAGVESVETRADAGLRGLGLRVPCRNRHGQPGQQ
ncbi:MAG: hypothetical protein IPO35_13875 [Uliginosibacterium sp.]|nr:hypothetical protein [Uliginosibacterium sp.]